MTMVRTTIAVSVAFLALASFGCKQDDTSLTAPDGLPEASTAASAFETTGASGMRVLNFVAPLSGDQEVPPVDTRASGVAKFQLKDGVLSYHLNVSRMEGVTQSHIHCAPAGMNGSVVAFLFGFVTGGVTANGRLASGTIAPENVISRPDSPACPGGVADFDDLIEKLSTGGAYVNVHTVAHPPGEIRGQIDRGNGAR